MPPIKFVAGEEGREFRGLIVDAKTGETTWRSYMLYVTEEEAIRAAHDHVEWLVAA